MYYRPRPVGGPLNIFDLISKRAFKTSRAHRRCLRPGATVSAEAREAFYRSRLNPRIPAAPRWQRSESIEKIDYSKPSDDTRGAGGMHVVLFLPAQERACPVQERLSRAKTGVCLRLSVVATTVEKGTRTPSWAGRNELAARSRSNWMYRRRGRVTIWSRVC